MAPSFVRATVRDMSGYTPGEQPGSEQNVVKLNTNENPFHPSDRVLQAIANVGKELYYAGDEVIALAADTEEHCLDAIRALLIQFPV